ncbi:MAG: DUF115 domain-containing protein [Acetatifactor sp.]|nr:DUF115 domain-containing protein [Acetatifactor sp.]
MEFVIWGAGTRGRRAADFIGCGNVKAFVESDRSLVGTYYKEIPIISTEEYFAFYRNYFLIVSPYRSKEIIELLKDQKVGTYLKFNHCPYEIITGDIKQMDEIPFPEINCEKVVIWGLSLYGILIGENLQKKGKQVTMVIKDGDEKSRELLKKSFCNILFQQKFSFSEDEIILQVMLEDPKAPVDKIIDVYHFTNFMNKFDHPELRKYKNKHDGERCFIIGNGPSLTASDLDILCENNEVCFGVNGIPLIFDKTSWRPTYHVCSDSKIMDIHGDLMLQNGKSDILLADTNKDFLKRAERHVNLFHWKKEEERYTVLPRFSDNIEKEVVGGGTVTYVCMQIAIYMGIREIYLLGVDCDYGDGETLSQKHFDKSYYLGNTNMNPSSITETLLAYQSAKEYAEKHDIKIYNATRGGKLEIFERVNFEELF